jgi:hypothetical protein
LEDENKRHQQQRYVDGQGNTERADEHIDCDSTPEDAEEDRSDYRNSGCERRLLHRTQHA